MNSDIKCCLQQHKDDRPRSFEGVQNRRAGLDLIILDIPDGLPVPSVSRPPFIVPSWNILQPGFLDHAFDFASAHVQDRGAVLLFFPDDLELKAKLRGYMTAYNFVLFREWMGINRLRMTSARDKSKTVSSHPIISINFSPCACLHFLILTLFILRSDASVLHLAFGQGLPWSFRARLLVLASRGTGGPWHRCFHR